MHMKKIALALIAALLCLAMLTGCGVAPNEPTAPSEPPSEPTTSTTTEPGMTTSEPETFTTTTSIPITAATSKPTTAAAPEPVILTPEQEIYPIGTREITVTWTNGADEDLIFGYPFILQARKGGGWMDAEPIEKLMFLLPGFLLQPGESKENTYDIGHYYGPLEAGRYRIAATYIYDAERPVNKNTPRHEVYAEFEIK